MSYKEAIELIHTLNLPEWNVYQSKVPNMIKYLPRIGYTVSDLDKLNILHLTGTKGKGSTLLFCESILRHHGVKTGAFISPNLVTLRERYRFNGEPVSEKMFAQHVFDIFEKLQKTKDAETDMPFRFGFLTLLAFDLFLKNGVEALVLEVGIGGEFDCTNVISAPVVCGVSSIHLDHVIKLGDTVQSIAWHKSGIFKPGAPAVTVPQSDGILPVLQSRAKGRGTTLIVAPPLDDYESEQPIKLGLAGEVQKENASLAIQMCKIWRDMVHPATSCRGRTHIIRHADATYFLDTAHTDVSIKAYSDWFIARTNEEKKKIRGRAVQVLIFHYGRGRDLLKPLRILAKVSFDVALFCPVTEDETSRESMFPAIPNKEQMSLTTEAFDQWKTLEQNNQLENLDSQGHDGENKGDHSHTPTLPFIVPSLEKALTLATCGKDGGYLNKEVTQRICDEFPKASETIRSADHAQVMIAGGHEVVGNSLSLLDNCR